MNDSQTDLLQPLNNDTFTFACHKGVRCFTECCRDLNLILTPYDIIRLKQRLDLTSSTFLEKYTRTGTTDGSSLPLVFLNMNDDERKTCPFVTPQGCSIYEDRPGACRTYPLGRAASKVKGQKKTSEKFFLVKEEHCRGFEQERTWTVKQWLEHEGLIEYNRQNDLWTEIITTCQPLFKKGLGKQKLDMFFMASYNLDLFRRFIFESSFLDRFQISPRQTATMHEDDLLLMEFALKWIKFFLLGEPAIKIKSSS